MCTLSWKLAAILVLGSIASGDEPTVLKYEGYKVIRLEVNSNDTLQVLTELQDDGTWDFWTEPRLNNSADLMVSPAQLPAITDIINKFNMTHEVMFDSLDLAIASERKASVNRLGNGMNWNAYQRLETIYTWMDSLVQTRRIRGSTMKVEVLTIGQSYEKRPMKILKISREPNRKNGGNRSAVWLDGGIHAREWIAVATVTFIAKEIIQAHLRSEPWAATLDWYIAPCINPDGYEYSHTNDRFWRKTRSRPREGTSMLDSVINLCMGTDPNRNWDFHWGGLGASHNPCAPTYRGKDSASEVEVQNIQNFMLSKKADLKLYITLHSYSQIILMPWGHSYIVPEDYDDLLRVARKAAKRLQAVHGTLYRTGATPYMLYPAAGGSHDWTKGVAGIKYSYTVELPDRGFFGFLLPAYKIIPVGEETLELVKSMAEDVMQEYHNSTKTSVKKHNSRQ